MALLAVRAGLGLTLRRSRATDRKAEPVPVLRAMAYTLALLSLILVSAFYLRHTREARQATEPAPQPLEPPTTSAAPLPASPVAATDAAKPRTAPPLPPPRPAVADTLASEHQGAERITAAAGFRSIVPIDGALVTGGWPMPDGRRYIAVASPQSASNGQIKIAMHAFAMPDALLRSDGWAPILKSASPLRIGGGYFDPAELADFLRQAREATGADMLTAPSLVLPFDMPATIMVSSATNGLMLSVVARRTDQPQRVELAVTTAALAHDANP